MLILSTRYNSVSNTANLSGGNVERVGRASLFPRCQSDSSAEPAGPSVNIVLMQFRTQRMPRRIPPWIHRERTKKRSWWSNERIPEQGCLLVVIQGEQDKNASTVTTTRVHRDWIVGYLLVSAPMDDAVGNSLTIVAGQR